MTTPTSLRHRVMHRAVQQAAAVQLVFHTRLPQVEVLVCRVLAGAHLHGMHRRGHRQDLQQVCCCVQ